ncbi:RNA polymerase sigma factor [Actinoplanes sp. NPDC020271]|uniref:RNA polymerase sigma factor n=1 Tax=Actinoplanes sp. NPDC020271 TaxID=3363896 RepID=UPI0037996D41
MNDLLHTEDGVLIRESVADPERFAPLFDRHARAVHRYLARRIGPAADDLLAETFLIAFRRRADYQPLRLEVRPWLLGIATNVLHRHVRQEERRYRALARAAGQQDPPAAPEGVEERMDAQAIRSELAAVLARLKAADRDALLLLAWGDCSYAEIAATLDVPLGTVRSRINRARRQTRAALGITFTEVKK